MCATVRPVLAVAVVSSASVRTHVSSEQVSKTLEVPYGGRPAGAQHVWVASPAYWNTHPRSQSRGAEPVPNIHTLFLHIEPYSRYAQSDTRPARSSLLVRQTLFPQHSRPVHRDTGNCVRHILRSRSDGARKEPHRLAEWPATDGGVQLAPSL